MKNTPLTEKHLALGAKMAPFAGYHMPISYSGINEEHQNVRTNVGVFDVCHMGEFIVRGKQALDLVQKVTSNDASALAIGQAQYSCLPNLQGGIVDDLLVYRLTEDMCSEGEMAFMLVVNASNMEKDWEWINSQNTFDTRLINISDQTGLIALQGPRSLEVLQPLTDIDLASLKYYTFTKGKVAGMENVLVSATGYTGAGGFELYLAAEHTAAMWDALFESGKPLGIQPAGLGARDTLRLEMGYCLYGNDIDDATSPLEAGLGWITKLNKGDFISSALFRKQKEAGVGKKLVGLTLEDRRVPRHGYPIEDQEGNLIGEVTSGTMSPSLQIPIGMGYVKTPFAGAGTSVFVVAGGKKLPARVTKLPFYK
ncbi:MAG: glycine cleavage system aminomethyltransferase GcvT [Haliscomenobacter sp.]|nr:glycine cleavage system aminomethyltransferase GcvT [Haliscomenobacter sp.]MBP9077969.1 glycine cleavage system aminomethyltransferase GcvT [Haliscomenobacter sp.]MBP9873700.1 glycine cleavage system aminomethyltransferase GcvT [Haliscomenobacter sp.]